MAKVTPYTDEEVAEIGDAFVRTWSEATQYVSPIIQEALLAHLVLDCVLHAEEGTPTQTVIRDLQQRLRKRLGFNDDEPAAI